MTRKPSSRDEPARKRTAGGAAPERARSSRPAPGTTGADTTPPQTPEDLLRAGLKAFRLENLLGLGTTAGATPPESALPGLGFSALDSFGLRKFEDVFDQRVAGALQRLGWPEPETVQALQQEIEQLRAELDALKTPPAPRTARSAAKKATASRSTASSGKRARS